MAGKSNGIKVGQFDFFLDIIKYNIRKIDPISFKHTAVFFIIAIFLASLAYTIIRLSQEWVAGQNARKAQPPVQTKKLEQTSQTADYDQQRKNDIFILNSALKSYFLDKKIVPANLEELKPDFIQEIPKDPEKKVPYKYNPSLDKKSWKLSAELSDGAVFEISGP